MPFKSVNKSKKIVLSLLLIIYFFPAISNIAPSALNPQKTKTFFNKKQQYFKDRFIITNSQKLHYVSTGNDTLPMLLFIHGSPGSWDAFKEYLADTGLQKLAYMVSVDRAGYGQSNEKGFASLKEQSDFIEPILKLRKNNKPITIISHSYGGPVSIKLCLAHQNILKQLILISPTISPSIEENIHWKRNLQTMSQWAIWHWMIAKDLKTSTQEMQPLPDEVRAMEKDFNLFIKPILEIHGTKDALAPFGNQQYVLQNFKNCQVDTISLFKKGHLIPFTMPEKLIEIIKNEITTY